MKAFTLLSLFVASPAFAAAMADGTYECTIYPIGAEKQTVKLTFDMKNDEVACKVGNYEEGSCETWFTFTPEKQNKFWLDGLYDGGYEYNEKGDWVVSADSDGCNIAKFTLYKDSDFTKGFLSSEFRCSGEKEKYAGKVSCKRN